MAEENPRGQENRGGRCDDDSENNTDGDDDDNEDDIVDDDEDDDKMIRRKSTLAAGEQWRRETTMFRMIGVTMTITLHTHSFTKKSRNPYSYLLEFHGLHRSARTGL